MIDITEINNQELFDLQDAVEAELGNRARKWLIILND